jgi:hypothetical protein
VREHRAAERVGRLISICREAARLRTWSGVLRTQTAELIEAARALRLEAQTACAESAEACARTPRAGFGRGPVPSS